MGTVLEGAAGYRVGGQNISNPTGPRTPESSPADGAYLLDSKTEYAVSDARAVHMPALWICHNLGVGHSLPLHCLL
jgi:hypothetical protein